MSHAAYLLQDDPWDLRLWHNFWNDWWTWVPPFNTLQSYMDYGIDGPSKLVGKPKLSAVANNPFDWQDEEMHAAARNALLLLRKQPSPTTEEVTQQFWLEGKLYDAAERLRSQYDAVPPHFAELISEKQWALVKKMNELDDAVYKAISTTKNNNGENRYHIPADAYPELFKQVQLEAEEGRKEVHTALLTYLRSIV